jgi:chemotaxis protein MotB
MADNKKGNQAPAEVAPPPPKCPECPAGLPGWMATFADLVTLLLTFFVLLLSFAKTETAKYEAALGSIRNAFGGNVFKHGKVIERGKSPDDSPSMIESQSPIRPFPIEFLTMEGMLDKREINRASQEELAQMKSDVSEFGLSDSVDIYEVPEGIKVRFKDKIYFEPGKTVISKVSVEVLTKMIKLLKDKKWTVFVEGHAGRGERGAKGGDPFSLSSMRAAEVTKSMIKRGVQANRITTAFYGDSRPDGKKGFTQKLPAWKHRRVEFLLRKTDLRTKGHKVDSK